MRRLRIAMLTYSTRPRGGVVHALEVSGALARRGHDVEVMALGRADERFFRDPEVPSRIVRFEPPDAPFDERIQAMLEAYTDGLEQPLSEGGFDLIHSQDCLSANAALALRDRGAIDHVIRTVHHIDDFTSPSLIACQDRSILGPDALLCVSEPWVQRLAEEFGVSARIVRNGVDARRHRPPADRAERDHDRAAAGLNGQLTILNIGGIEPRKGSLTLLEAFGRLRELAPKLDPVLLVAGGATLFDYRSEIDRFHDRVGELELGDHVRVLGSLSDDELSRLYRAADLFAFPVDQGGVRAGRARGAGMRASGGGVRHRRAANLPRARPQRAAGAGAGRPRIRPRAGDARRRPRCPRPAPGRRPGGRPGVHLGRRGRRP